MECWFSKSLNRSGNVWVGSFSSVVTHFCELIPGDPCKCVAPKPGTVCHNNLLPTAQNSLSSHSHDPRASHCAVTAAAMAREWGRGTPGMTYQDTSHFFSGCLAPEPGYQLTMPKSRDSQGRPVCPCALQCLLPTFGPLPPLSLVQYKA